jgi:hypothetical protein
VNFGDFINSSIPQEGPSPLLAVLLLAVDDNGVIDATRNGAAAAVQALLLHVALFGG